MKKSAVALSFTLLLTNCAALQAVDNVSPTNLYEAELVFDGSVKTFNELKGLCVKRVLPPACRTYVVKGQNIIRNAYAADKAARNFITSNPTLDATNVIQAFTNLVLDFKNNVAALGATK